MEIKIKPTEHFVVVEGRQVRLWTGTTEDGTAVHAFVAWIALPCVADQQAFEELLTPITPPIGVNEMLVRNFGPGTPG